ncbi:MAG: histidine kinase dimerization/phospho-acceptor domain-containing protein [Sphingomonadaceae bacterium]
MRFDDRLKTILAIDPRDDSVRAALWAQIVDLIAQKRVVDPWQNAFAQSKLREWQMQVPATRRQSIARSVAGPHLPFALVQIFATDTPPIAAMILRQVVLSEQEWAQLIPKLPVASRALLRERSDLPATTQQMLASYGTSDFALSSQMGTPEAVASEVPQPEALPQQPPQPRKIADLVARIEAFQRERSSRLIAAPSQSELPSSFRFECDSDGMINWVEGVPRGALIGLTIAKMAEPYGGGVDGHVAGAFRHRSEFSNGRLSVPGKGPVSGIWLATASPLFDAGSGRFEGYRGVARRPDPLIETARQSEFGQITGLSSDSVRQLVHELRTPLNAIRGFAEMISAQLLGPASSAYRQKAELIVADGATLMNIFDDLESAARIDSHAYQAQRDASVDLVQSLAFVARDLEPVSNLRNVTLRFAIARQLPRGALDSVSCERLMARLIGIALGAANPAETIDISLGTDGKSAQLIVDRPVALQGIPEHLLLDPSHAQDGSWPEASPLGLAFTLRLIANLARSIGGQFVIGDGNFMLMMPMDQANIGEQLESV